MENSVLLGSLIEESAIKQITTVGALMTNKGRLELTENNLLNDTKALQVRVFNDKGQGFKIICSSAVSKAIRAKDMKLGDLHHMPIIEYETKGSGEIIPMITFPEGSGAVLSFSAEKNTKAPFERKSSYKPEDLVAF